MALGKRKMPGSGEPPVLTLRPGELDPWLRAKRSLWGRRYKIPAVFLIGKLPGSLQAAWLGFEPGVTRVAARRLAWSDARMGIGLSTRLQGEILPSAKYFRCWLIGEWGADLLGEGKDASVFYVRDWERIA